MGPRITSPMGNKVCRICCVGKGVILLRNSNSGSSSNGVDVVISTLNALDQVVGNNFVFGKKDVSDKYGGFKTLQQLLNKENSLAKFPFGSLLHSTESASGSAPPLSSDAGSLKIRVQLQLTTGVVKKPRNPLKCCVHLRTKWSGSHANRADDAESEKQFFHAYAHYAAQSRLGGANVPIVVSESGWPSAGDKGATMENAGTYYRTSDCISMKSTKGSPL
ncbi:probable phosphoinositide phosphatase SAC9 [Tanacetum coccineum]